MQKEELEKEEAVETGVQDEESKVEVSAQEDGEVKETSSEADSAPAAPDWKEMYARTMADFDNFRKRTARDREDLVKAAGAEIILDLLPTIDNLALCLEKAENKEDPFIAGVKMVYDGLVKMLSNHGATPIDSVGEPLDTNYHEALAQLPSDTVEDGKIITEVKRGWLLHGKLLRAAQVVVSSGKGA